LTDSQAFRQEVRNQADVKQSQIQGGLDGFDDKHELTRTPDGKVVGHQSMVKQTVQSLGRDAEATIEDGSAAALKSAEEMKARMKNSEYQKAIDATPEVPPMMGRLGKKRN
jgi:hypothetical protein